MFDWERINPCTQLLGERRASSRGHAINARRWLSLIFKETWEGTLKSAVRHATNFCGCVRKSLRPMSVTRANAGRGKTANHVAAI